MRSMPVLAKQINQARIEISVERSLRKTEVHIYRLALRNERGGQHMKPLIPNKCTGLGQGNERSRRNKKRP